MNVCIVIPNYNHNNINALLYKLEPYNLPCIIVDDGSNDATKQQLAKANRQFSWVYLITLPYNQGKGAAVLAGLRYAIAQNYTHALQIDADGQHDPADIPKFLIASKKNPQALITGQPIYDKAVPKNRLYGRKITNFWVRLETLSADIKDAMCGFRVYPLPETKPIIAKYTLGKRMDFDIEIIVRMYWEKITVISIPTPVLYAADGISHFRLWRDNLTISWLHTRLFFGMLKRLVKKPQANKHWAQIKEKGSLLGMNIVLFGYKWLGRKLTYYLLLYPITAYFYCCSYTARKASKEYLVRLHNKASVFKHFLTFAESIVDKCAVWNNDISLKQVEFLNADLFSKQIAQKKGGIIFTAHLGNMEIARALSNFDHDIKLNILMFDKNAKKITSLLEKINPQFKLNIIYLEDLGMHLAINLHAKVAAGEFVVIAADRTSINQPKRYIKAKFLDDMAYFPEGPFILAGLLQCPVYLMLCLKQSQDSFKIIFTEFARYIDIRKKTREQQLQYHAQKYAQLLEKYCRQYPLQWFNFFNFWRAYED